MPCVSRLNADEVLREADAQALNVARLFASCGQSSLPQLTWSLTVLFALRRTWKNLLLKTFQLSTSTSEFDGILPLELFLLIASFLDFHSRVALCLVCK